MGLYKLAFKSNGLSSGVLEEVIIGNINYEKDFECWLENSPNVLFEEDEGDTLIWIGRQVRATIGETGKYPDLIGIDSSGDLVIVELKKGKTPRDVVAQALEYATWVASLSHDDLNTIACDYFKSRKYNEGSDLLQTYKEVFYPDAEEDIVVEFNRNQKIFIVAEEVTPLIRQVTSHLRTKYQMKILCIEYKVYKSDQGEYIVSTEKIGSYDELGVASPMKTGMTSNTTRWNQPIKIKDAVHEAIKTITKGELNTEFQLANVYNELVKQYPDINRSSVDCQVYSDCVNHSSRKHYPSGQQDLYYRTGKGRYRLYNKNADGEWTWEGKPITI
jgi:hypothetical protein